MLYVNTAEIPVHSTGYVWVEDALDLPPFSQSGEPTLIPTGDGPERFYDPFEEAPGLFLTVAKLDPSKEAILEFASSYGNIFRGCTLFAWRREIQTLSAAVDAWQSGVPVEQLVERWRAAFNIGVKIRPVYRDGALVLMAVVSNLHTALWLQFSSAVAGETEFRPCVWCSKFFDPYGPRRPGKRRGRGDRLYCSDNCRVKHYLARRERAVQLRAAGGKLREIAKEVGTDLDTLKGWLGEGK